MTPEFAKDFIALQSEIMTMPKDKSGYGYKYTDLDTIISNLKPLMKKHKIGFYQLLKTADGVTGVETFVIHESGDSFGNFVSIPEIQVGKANNAQNIGAAITYFKRYALAAAFGVSSDEDIDCSSQKLAEGKAKAEPMREVVIKAPTKKTTSNTVSDETRSKLYTKEQMQELASIINQTDGDGLPVFSEGEKEILRGMLKKDGYTATKKAVEDILKEKKTQAELDGVPF